MLFNHPLQHRPESLAELEARLARPKQDGGELLALAKECVIHGHSAATDVIAKLRQNPETKGMVLYHQYLERAYENLRRDFQLENQSEQTIRDFYSLNGHMIIPAKSKSNKLLVLFATMFNNFNISTLAMVSIIQKHYDVNILILKDATLYVFHNGVEGFATDPDGIATGIQDVAKQIGADSIYISAFSLGGYIALLTSMLLPTRGYLGFSHYTDQRVNSPLLFPSPVYPTSKLDNLDPKWRLDLRPILEKADPAIPRWMYYGGQSPNDIAHGENLAGLNTIKVICLPTAWHETVEHALSSDSLITMYGELLSA